MLVEQLMQLGLLKDRQQYADSWTKIENMVKWIILLAKVPKVGQLN